MDRIQRYNQRLLRNAVRETRLITSIDVTAGRRIRVTSATWDEYWGQCGPWAREIAQLKAAWTALIAGNLQLTCGVTLSAHTSSCSAHVWMAMLVGRTRSLY